eukprot:scaffold1558_cov403-Prasinococcus_capsulatus_cf.AAC.16
MSRTCSRLVLGAYVMRGRFQSSAAAALILRAPDPRLGTRWRSSSRHHHGGSERERSVTGAGE